MINLGTSDSLRLVTSSTAQIDVTPSWADLVSGTVTPGGASVRIATATTTVVVPSPASGTRGIKSLYIVNSGGVANALTLHRWNGATAYPMRTVTLAAGEALLVDEGNWLYLAATGMPYLGTTTTVPGVGDYGDVIVSGGGAVWALDYAAVNPVIAPVWANITSKPAAITALSGTNTGDQTITLTGDMTGSGTGSFATTLATVNSNVGAFGSASSVASVTVNAKGLVTAASAVPIAISSGAVSGLGALATQSTVSLTTQATGTLQAAQIGALSGDVTSTAGSYATTIAAASVTLAKMANLAANSIIGNNTGSAATPIALTAAQVKALLAIASTDVSGLGTLATQSGTFSGTHSGTSSGTNTGDQTITLTGDMTGSGTGAITATLATVNGNVGSFGLAGSVAQVTVNAKGLITAAANVAISIAASAINDATTAGRAMLTATTVAAQTALIDVFTSTTKGLAPASGGGTTNFLRADGTWAAPAGGGGGTDFGQLAARSQNIGVF
jgi:hypothetical protein